LTHNKQPKTKKMDLQSKKQAKRNIESTITNDKELLEFREDWINNCFSNCQKKEDQNWINELKEELRLFKISLNK